MPERKKVEPQEKCSEVGVLIVVTGASGAGKDTVKNEVIKHPGFLALGIKNVITCTDRPRRTNANPPEPADAYHFKTREELDQMADRGELAEDITDTGLSRKATPISELERLLNGEDLIWRIDPSRAADVAAGTYFPRMFPKNAQVLQQNTLVICINAPREVVESRRRVRDGENYNAADYEERDRQEAEHLDILLERAAVIENLDGQLETTTEAVLEVIREHHAKIKNKKE